MKNSFQNWIQAVDWIASDVDNEGQFEVLREQLTFNYIYTNTYFLKIVEKESLAVVISLKQK